MSGWTLVPICAAAGVASRPSRPTATMNVRECRREYKEGSTVMESTREPRGSKIRPCETIR